MRLIYLLPILFLFTACVSYDDFDTKKVEGSFGLANQLEEDERYEEAINQYRDVKNRFPYSQYAVESELRIADIQFKKEAFPEAQGAYQIFKELHPKHKKIDYVNFKIAESIYMQLPSTIDRDLSLAPKAIQQYRYVVQTYPSSKYAKDAQEKIRESIHKLAEKELYIADFYFRTDRFKNAIIRYEKYLKEFPTHHRIAYALFKAGAAAGKAGDDVKKSKMYRELLSRYPNSTEARWAKGDM